MSIRDVWEECTVGLKLGGVQVPALLQLEREKDQNPYRNLKNRGLKSAVRRRVHRAEYINTLRQHHRWGF